MKIEDGQKCWCIIPSREQCDRFTEYTYPDKPWFGEINQRIGGDDFLVRSCNKDTGEKHEDPKTAYLSHSSPEKEVFPTYVDAMRGYYYALMEWSEHLEEKAALVRKRAKVVDAWLETKPDHNIKFDEPLEIQLAELRC